MMLGRRVTLVAAVAMVSVLSSPGTAFAHGKVHCGEDVGRGTFDPIVSAGQEPAGHEHTFLANRHILDPGLRANATYASLTGAATNCENTDDTAAYWFPTIRAGGNPLPVKAFIAYYYPGSVKDRNLAVATAAYPPDMRIVAGRRDGSGTRHAFWSCGAFTNRDGKYLTPAEARCDLAKADAGHPDSHIGLRLKVWFPDCWDGQLNSHTGPASTADYADDGSVINHLAYSREDASCPPGFARKLPSLLLDIRTVYRGNGSNVTISSGPHASLHADFWNTWVQSGGTHGGLTIFVSQCVSHDGQGGHPHGSQPRCGS